MFQLGVHEEEEKGKEACIREGRRRSLRFDEAGLPIPREYPSNEGLAIYPEPDRACITPQYLTAQETESRDRYETVASSRPAFLLPYLAAQGTE